MERGARLLVPTAAAAPGLRVHRLPARVRLETRRQTGRSANARREGSQARTGRHRH
ncbi:hypothetical protein JYU34_017947 [Plutella xylostella]|uniref:Uncharacterized protein n=1 Tax=Plutella xylostella TaxID=51655 RepID=A0ABQ7PZN1_PLUXY|nr:hypothetical protein JYU34_017947 [Plutella xylostella]